MDWKIAKHPKNIQAVLEERPPRIELDVHLDAPLIVVPRLSTSTDVIVVDLGEREKFCFGQNRGMDRTIH